MQHYFIFSNLVEFSNFVLVCCTACKGDEKPVPQTKTNKPILHHISIGLCGSVSDKVLQLATRNHSLLLETINRLTRLEGAMVAMDKNIRKLLQQSCKRTGLPEGFSFPLQTLQEVEDLNLKLNDQPIANQLVGRFFTFLNTYYMCYSVNYYVCI